MNKKNIKLLAHLLGIHCGPVQYIEFGRLIANNTGVFVSYVSWLRNRIGKRYGIQIENTNNIGNGLKLIHPFGITVNPRAKLGNDCVIFKGATIGSVRAGNREGAPTIEDRVVFGVNSFVCGGITIGHDSLIAANAFVDFDVPPHSLVIGNPGTIHHKENASKDYLDIVID